MYTLHIDLVTEGGAWGRLFCVFVDTHEQCITTFRFLGLLTKKMLDRPESLRTLSFKDQSFYSDTEGMTKEPNIDSLMYTQT